LDLGITRCKTLTGGSLFPTVERGPLFLAERGGTPDVRPADAEGDET
jgi:hypothetical protein